MAYFLSCSVSWKPLLNSLALDLPHRQDVGVGRQQSLASCLWHPASPHFVYHILFMVARTSVRHGSKGG
jgi:hypothetical protein